MSLDFPQKVALLHQTNLRKTHIFFLEVGSKSVMILFFDKVVITVGKKEKQRTKAKSKNTRNSSLTSLTTLYVIVTSGLEARFSPHFFLMCV